MSRAKKDVDTPHITCQKCGWDLSFLYDTIEYDTYKVVYYHCPVCRRLSTVTVFYAGHRVGGRMGKKRKRG